MMITMVNRSVLLRVLSLSFPVYSQAISIDPAQPVHSLIDHTKEQLESLLGTLGEESRRTVFVAGQQALLGLQNLQYTASYTLDRAFKDLNDSEKRILEDALFVTETLAGKTNEAIAQLDTVAQRIESTAARIPFGDTSPRVFSIYPSYVASRTTSGNTLFQLKGSLMGTGQPVAWMNGKRYDAATKTDTEVSFLLPNSELFNSSSGVGYYNIYVSLFNNKNVIRPYRITLFRLPVQIGKVQVTAVVKSLKQLREPRRQDMEVRAPHCRSEQSCIPATARPGWLIDTQTVKFAVAHSDGGENNGLKSMSTAGFCIELRATSYGCQSLPFGQEIKGTQGHISGTATWEEYKENVETMTNQSVADSDRISWSADYTKVLPEGTVGFILQVRLYDGRTVVFDRNTSNGLFTITFDPNSRLLLVKPNNPDVLLK